MGKVELSILIYVKKISVQNNFSLIEVEPEKYLLMPEKKEDLNHVRILYEDSGDVFAIDPLGGPFLSLGRKIEGISGTINRIDIDIQENTLIYLIFSENERE